ncbi:MAG: hypothetical protein AAF602_20645, partial [Myxococcota bacterium]
HLKRLARVFVDPTEEHAAGFPSPDVQDVDHHEFISHVIASCFVQFLKIGLQTGRSSWPPTLP